MTTQVQIGQGRSHLTYLRIITSQFATGLGMARKDSEDVFRAVTDVCQYSAKGSSSDGPGILVSLDQSGACMIVELRGFPTNFEAERSANGAPRGLESVCRFVDCIEIVREDDGDMVRLTKYVKKPENAVKTIQNLSALRSSGLNS